MNYFDGDTLHEECGVMGVYLNNEQEAANYVYYGLFALQHRGQESAGITVNNEGRLESAKGMGLVSDVFEERNLQNLVGNIAIGHVRYSTTGDKDISNCQPLVAKYKHGSIALAHNGNLTNSDGVREMLEDEGVIFQSTTDSEAILNLIARHYNRGIEAAIRNTMQLIKGAYAIVITTQDQMIGIRDPHGLRPLCIGKLKDGYVLASESCALDVVDAEFVRDVMPGEIVIINQDGLTSIKPSGWCQKKLCVFELIYLARPDSIIDGNSVYQFREKAGEILFREAGIEADVVIAVPDSGIPSAIGYSKASGLPYREGLTKNRYIGRTFIQPTQAMRENAVRIKLNPLKHNIEGKRVVMTDDSIVRGTTCKRIVEQVRKAGASEVHVCITSPPVKYGCYFGIDTPDREKLVGAMMSVEEIRDYIGADSLTYLSLDGLKEACGGSSDFCRACFNGNYPMEVPLHEISEEK
ncbi:amidophosphoribosyltransferase [Niameybacter massiliensis]|uniref:amidophosphoribosyltransferase n=1 Tax=Niameybacter massiliensis TaxID=1658108 RepID=UPI0006B50BD6|nr:amidophosphoribosyltransferase [Niameybacter massiliensis]